MAQRPLAAGMLPSGAVNSPPGNGAAANGGTNGTGANGAAAAVESGVAALANLTLRQIVLATMTVLVVTLAFLLLYRFYSVVFLLFVAISIQIALDPLVRFLTGRGINRIAALFAIYFALFAIIGALFWFGSAPLADQVRDVSGTLPAYYLHMRDTLLHAPIGFIRGLASVLPQAPSPSLFMAAVNQEGGQVATEAAASAAGAAQAASGTSIAQAWQWLAAASSAFFGLFAVFAIAFYWTLESDVIVGRLILRAPAARRDELRALIAESQGKIGAFFRGQLILCSIIGLASTIAYMALGIPNAILLGLLMALFESVPLVGPFLGAVPAIIVTMSAAPDKVSWVIGALLLIQLLESNLLVPRVMDRSVGVNAIITMLALAAFGALFGLLGALLAVPLAAILQIVIGRLLFNTPINDETSPTVADTADISRSRLGVLRLEAQNVVHALRRQARNAGESEAIQDPSEQTEDDIEAIAAELDTLLSNAEANEANGANGSGQGDELVFESAPRGAGTAAKSVNTRRSA